MSSRFSSLQYQQKQKPKKNTEISKTKFKEKRLVVTIFQLATKIISYARAFSIKLKKKNAHQAMLFPTSIKTAVVSSPDRNESLIQQYSKKDKNWYPFFFSSCHIFVDNHHLELFDKRKGLPADLSHLGYGKVTCFGEFINFTIGKSKQYRQMRSSKKIGFDKKQSGVQIKSQSFFQSLQSKLNVNEIKNKLKNTISGFTIPEQQQQSEPVQTRNIIFLGTDNGHILITDPKTKRSGNSKIPTGKPISLLAVHKNHIMVQSENLLYFFKFGVIEEKIKLKQIFNCKLESSGKMHRTTFVRYTDFYFIFYIDGVGIKKAIVKERKISNILLEETICEPDKYNPFTNLKVFHQASQNRIIVTVSCTKEILVYSYHYIQNKHSLIYKMPNPKNPPMNPRVHTFSCIQYFPKINRSQNTISQINNGQKGPRESQKRQSIEINRQSTGFQSLIQEEEQLVIAISFTERVYFIRVWEDRVQLSKRAKFLNRVVKIQMYNEEGVIVIMHKTLEADPEKQQATSVEKMPKLQIVATVLSKIMSFHICVHTEILQKITYTLQIDRKVDNAESKPKFKSAFMMVNQELMILSENTIERVAVNTWDLIYKKMHYTQNIQLLNFLIIIKNHRSLFLKPPVSFEGLQKFFPADSFEEKQILLEYYYEINQQPPQYFIDQVMKKCPQIMLPFILEHKIANLNESTKENLIQYWKTKDERIVEELIMAGCQFGWELAIKEGWMRPLRKIVSMGMEIHFPLLKLSSFIVAELQKLQKLDEIGNEDVDYQKKCNEVINKINNYCQQTIEYSALAIQYFLDPQEIEQLDDLKQFILILLRNEIIGNCIKYKPRESVKLISKLFKAQQRVFLIDKLNIQDFMHYQKQFKQIVRKNYLNVSECIFSYMSQLYRQLTQTKQYTMDQQTRFRELLAVQHAKLIRLCMSNKPSDQNILVKGSQSNKGKFQFTRSYLIQMLIILCTHNNEYLKELIHDECVEIEKNREEFQCYVEDLLVKIWMDAKASPMDNLEGSTDKVQPMRIEEIKSIMISLEQVNSSNNFLLICLMLDLPANEYSIKILRKFIYSPNLLIQQRLFDWLMPTLQQLDDKEARQSLQSELMNHLKNIIEINKEKSRELFDRYFRNKEKEIIRKIDNDPHLQLEYLEMIILEATQNQVQLEEYYLNLYLKLLIMEEPERVVSVLEESFSKGKSQKIKYNVQEALRVSLDIETYSEKNRVQMYLYQKLGQIQKCIASYLKILQALFWQYIQVYQRKQQSKQPNQQQNKKVDPVTGQYQFQQSNRASKKLSIISQMINNKLHSKSDSKRIELEESISVQFKELTDLIFRQSLKKYEYLKIPLDAMVSIFEEIRHQKMKYKTHYLGMLGFYFGRIIVESFQKSCFQFFNQWLKNQTKIDLNVLKKYLYDGYKKLISHETLLKNVSMLDKSVLLQNVSQALTKMQKCVYSEALCTVCLRSFTEYTGQARLFNCGHLFHETCIEQDQNGQDYCWECVYRNQMQAMIDHTEINMVAMVEKYCTKKSNNMGIEEQKKEKEVIISTMKKRMNRLGIFDKKIVSLDNQVEILDMKLEILQYYQNIQKKD